MKTWSIKFQTYHESYNGYDLNDGWKEYEVEARTGLSAINKAKKLWKKEYGSPFWIRSHTCMIK